MSDKWSRIGCTRSDRRTIIRAHVSAHAGEGFDVTRDGKRRLEAVLSLPCSVVSIEAGTVICEDARGGTFIFPLQNIGYVELVEEEVEKK